MVKIHPANLGVGLYQHDIKAKHLKDSLDAVVESAVNFVGVDVNSASPALLRYVSGMNALTARRVYEHRREKGPFKNREELRSVPGFGDQTFVQAAGFLKVIGGENPLDATWIHPESYEIARGVLDKIGCDVSELAKAVPAPAKKEEQKPFAAELVETGKEPAARDQEPGAGDRESGVRSQEPEGLSHSEEAPSATSATIPFSEIAAAIATEPVPEPASIPLDESTGAPAAEPPSDEADPSDAVSAAHPPAPSPALEAAPSPEPRAPSLIAERAARVDVEKLAAELAVGTHLLQDILASLTRPALDPRDSLTAPVFRRGIMKLEDLSPGMELSGTVLNVVDFGVFVDIGLSDSGLVHISRLADRFIRDPHEVVGVGDVLKVWVVDVDKTRRRVSLTAIAPGSERPQRAPRERGEQRPPRQPRQQRGGEGHRGGQPAPQGAGQGGGQEGARQDRGGQQSGPPGGHRPPRQYGGGGGGGGRRDQRRGGGRPQEQRPKTIERPPTKPKPNKPITKAQEEGKEPMRSFSDLQQLFNKKKQKPKDQGPPEPQPES
jgi:uncharacterized protein